MVIMNSHEQKIFFKYFFPKAEKISVMMVYKTLKIGALVWVLEMFIGDRDFKSDDPSLFYLVL